MTLKQLEPSDVLGENYYVYNITSSDYNPSLNGSITITCTLKNVYGTAVASKSLTLYQNGTSKGSQTTNSSGVATWSITCSTGGLQTFRIGAAAIEVYVDNKSNVGHTHTKSQITDFPTIPSASSTVPSADTTNGSYGSGTTYARSNHTHPKSSLYAESSHTHTKSEVTDFPSIPSKTSDLTNDSGFLTNHQDISGKIDTAGTGLSKTGTTLNHSNSVTALTTSSFKKFKHDAQGHITETSNVTASDLPSHEHNADEIWADYETSGGYLNHITLDARLEQIENRIPTNNPLSDTESGLETILTYIDNNWEDY